MEDGLWIGGQLKSRNGLHRVRTISLEVQERCENLDPSGGRPNSNLLRPGGLPDFKSKSPGSIPGSPGVRIWPRLGKKDFVCIPGIVSLVGALPLALGVRLNAI